jgi:uncharacterized membrane protein (UPF0127 family)
MKKKLSVYNIAIVAIFALIIIISSLVLFINPVNKNLRKPVTNMNEKSSIPTKPVFRKDGELRFVDNKTNKVISTINIEVADTDPEREQGLMYRESMAENEGMLFLMGEETLQAFWMKNTIISLDILYADSDRRIVSIHKNCKPYSLDQIPSEIPATYVVEVNAGYSSKYGIEVGDLISF